MAQTGYTPISLYYSSTASAAPTAGNLVAGELAINTADGKLFYKDSAGVVQTLATKDTTAGTFTSITDSGNLTFTGTGNRIRGDFSNATAANRVLFQSSTTNGNTQIQIIPNGTSVVSTLNVSNGTDPDNSALGQLRINSTVVGLDSTITGTGTYLPLTMRTGGSERLRIDTSGNVGIGTSSPSAQLTVANDASISGLFVGKGPYAVSTNTTFGVSANAYTTTGSNTSVGYSAGGGNATGTNNSYFGIASGSQTTSTASGSFNSGFGDSTLRSITTGGSNVAIGSSALYSNTTASNNTAVGYQAGYSNTTGTGNNLLGYQSGYTTTIGSYNNSFGTNALGLNVSGSHNSAFGQAALYNNTASDNAAFGSQALVLNTSGTANTAIGRQALQANTTASNNTAVGYQAGYSGTTASNYCTLIGYKAGYSNTVEVTTAVGWESLLFNTTGLYNTAMGGRSLNANTTGSYNTAMGKESLYSNTTATYNTAVGYQAGYSNTTGTGNSILGYQALYVNVTGNYNTAIGQQAIGNSTGSSNTAVGYQALITNTTASNNTAVGYLAGYNTTTGGNNVFIGNSAGFTATTATSSVIIGNNAGYSISAGTASRNTIIGANAGYNVTTGSGNTFIGGTSTGGGSGAGNAMTTGSQNTIIGSYGGNEKGLDIRTASNYIVLSDGDGNPRLWLNNNGSCVIPKVYLDTTASAANVNVDSAGALSRSTSALKYKQDIRDLPYIDINKFRPVVYKSKCENDDQTLDHFGIIADEVDAAGITELVNYGVDGEVEGFQYERLTVVLIKAVQELKAEVDSLKQQLGK